MLFKQLPDRQLAWRDVWLGGFVTAFLFNAGKSAITWYMGTQAFESVWCGRESLTQLLTARFGGEFEGYFFQSAPRTNPIAAAPASVAMGCCLSDFSTKGRTCLTASCACSP